MTAIDALGSEGADFGDLYAMGSPIFSAIKSWRAGACPEIGRWRCRRRCYPRSRARFSSPMRSCNCRRDMLLGSARPTTDTSAACCSSPLSEPQFSRLRQLRKCSSLAASHGHWLAGHSRVHFFVLICGCRQSGLVTEHRRAAQPPLCSCVPALRRHAAGRLDQAYGLAAFLFRIHRLRSSPFSPCSVFMRDTAPGRGRRRDALPSRTWACRASLNHTAGIWRGVGG